MRGNESLERVRTSRRTAHTCDQCYAMEQSVRIDYCAIISKRTKETEMNEPKKTSFEPSTNSIRDGIDHGPGGERH